MNSEDNKLMDKDNLLPQKAESWAPAVWNLVVREHMQSLKQVCRVALLGALCCATLFVYAATTYAAPETLPGTLPGKFQIVLYRAAMIVGACGFCLSIIFYFGARLRLRFFKRVQAKEACV